MLPKLPAPHLVIRDFLPPAELEALLAWTLENEGRFYTRQLSAAGGQGVRKNILNDLGPCAETFSKRLVADYHDWVRKLRVSDFELSRYELRIGAYGDGDHFEYHLDASLREKSAESTRTLTAVYYYFQEPQHFSGGDIRLYDIGADPTSDARRSITPEQNSLLVFPSWVGHDVTAVQCPGNQFSDFRFAVNCWLHRLPKG